MMKFIKKSKKGVTLVESVFAVVILSILTIGIISLLTAGGAKIYQLSGESNAYSQATSKMDLVISAVSNGSPNYITKEPTVALQIDELKSALGFDSDVTISAVMDLYDSNESATVLNCRGWYLTLTYKGVTVKGFASNSEGAFDKG